jgi:hypothetical protein
MTALADHPEGLHEPMNNFQAPTSDNNKRTAAAICFCSALFLGPDSASDLAFFHAPQP